MALRGGGSGILPRARERNNGIIEDVCPKCGRSEDAHNQPFERIRRITGYLVGTLDRFNDAKRAEESQRVKHEVPAANAAE